MQILEKKIGTWDFSMYFSKKLFFFYLFLICLSYRGSGMERKTLYIIINHFIW